MYRLKRINNFISVLRIAVSAITVIGLAGCLGGEDLNTETASYMPQPKPLNVISAEDVEVKPGDTVNLSSRLVGTVNGQTLIWSQISGASVDIGNTTSPTISFVIPASIISDKLVFQVAALDSSGNQVNDADGNALTDTVEVTVFDPESVILLDVSGSSATLNSATLSVPGDDHYVPGAAGEIHTADLEPGQSVTFTIDDESGFYTLNIRYVIPSDYGGKMANALVNGVKFEFPFDATGQWAEYRVGVIKLNDGVNTIEVGGGWGYYRIDSISLIPAAQPSEPLAVAGTLINPNATNEALALMEYLSANYATSTLSGQTEFPRKEGDTFPLTEFNKITAATGDDAPAIVAFDYMNYSASHVGAEHNGLSEAMIEAHNDKNMILSALFHWRSPSGTIEEGIGEFYTEKTTFNLAAAIADTSSDEYAELLVDIDTVSLELKKLANASIPILWRPLHEAEGGWFWWGAQGSTALKDLWMLMHDRMTNMHGLNNLIWVYTHTRNLDTDWYPGDDYVDIVGYDGYADPKNDSTATFATQYTTLMNRHNGQKMVALTETGAIPNVALMHEQRAWWSFFITWNSAEWDPRSVIGPQGADPATIDANYAYDGLLNLADIPGGVAKLEAGTYADFDVSTVGFQAQVSWSPTAGLATSDKWASSGSRSLYLMKDLSAEDAPTNVILQTYPVGGIDVTGITKLTLDAHAINAGDATTIKLWAKNGDGVWRDEGANVITIDGSSLSIDVSDIELLQGFGLQIENFDTASTAAEFYLDNIRLDDTLMFDFEPEVFGFQAQVNWGPTNGLTVTDDWATSGERALTIIKDLSVIEGINNVIFQTYPVNGIDVTAVSMLTLSAHAVDAGSDTTIKLWAKDGDGVWRDAGAAVISENALELSIDVSDLERLQAFGLQIENFDSTSTNARFYLDNVRLDDVILFNFEGTKGWEFQVNWSPVDGIHLSSDWKTNGDSAMAGKTQLVDGDDNIILQTYPAGGLILGDVSTLNIMAYATDAGDVVTAQLWVKDQDGVWRDSGAVAITENGVQLSVDISDYVGIQGFGVRFQGAVNSATESKYFIDNVVFE
jgi:mannan endo-1,4-beta-mannosidase